MVCNYRPEFTKMFVFALLLTFHHARSKSLFMSERERKPRHSNKQEGFHQQGKFQCPGEFNVDSSVRACSVSNQSLTEQFQEYESCNTQLSLRVRKVVVKICISQNRLLLPNASVIYVSKSVTTYPVYHEEISKNIKSFFNGRIHIFDEFFPFSGDIFKSKFNGKSVVFGNIFILQCQNVGKSFDPIEENACFDCRAFCSTTQKIKKSLDTIDGITIDFPPTELIQQFQFLHGQMHRKNRLKRKFDNNHRKLTCSLHLVSDHLFFEYVGNSDVVKTSNIMLGLVNKVDTIFRNNFNAKFGLDEVGFAVKHVTVYQNEDSSEYTLGGSLMTSDEYLRQFSRYDFSSVCLAVGFTFRNFGGVLGTAFPAFSSLHRPGGICNRRIKINSHSVSYNTVIMSFLSNGGQLSEESLSLTLTHELGHSFGARHDETEECLPGEDIGNYIMSSTVNSGDKPNNFKFSPCSVRNIVPVIVKKEKCLQSPNRTPLCGNAIPEDGEECDCGMSNQCMTNDPCCIPADDTSHKPCTIRRYEGKLCSPVVSSCCNSSCGYISSDVKRLCGSLNVCSRKTTCSGGGERCPPTEPVPHGTPCQNGRHVCKDNTCSGDVCAYHNLMRCKCTAPAHDCKLCCMRNDSRACQPANYFGIFYNHSAIAYPCAILDAGVLNMSSLSVSQILKKAKVLSTWPFVIAYIVIFLFIFICISLTRNYALRTSDQLAAMRCGKLIAIFSMGAHQSELYKRRIEKIDNAYVDEIKRALLRINLEYVTAVARLQVLFPSVPEGYIKQLVKLCANELMAVRLLLTQGCPMITFSTSMDSLTYVMKQVTIRYKNAED